MKVKMKFCILAMLVLTVAAVWFETGEAGAFTISDDGEYALVLNLKVSDADATIDGQQSGKVIKFNFDEDEEAIRVSDLTQGICPYNGKNEFSGWAGDSASSETVEMLSKDEFSSTGSMNGVSYTKGHSIYALFLGAEIEQPQQYYLLFNAVDGEVLTDGVSTGEDKVVLSGTMDQLTSQDLSKYTAQREGCTFCGWGFNSEISNGQFFTSTSLTPSELEKYSPMTIFALYKKNTFEGNYLVLALDANGGTIDGQDVEKCDYLSDSSKSSAMPIFLYVPKRRGYKFTGWHADKEGSSTKYTLMSNQYWRRDEEPGLEKDALMDNGTFYKTVTLYAGWEKDTSITKEPMTITSTGDIQGSVEAELLNDGDYSLDLVQMPITDALAAENVKYLLGINLLDDQEIVQINGVTVKVKLALPEELKDYDSYEVVYVKDGKITERLACTVEDGYVVFNTSHLSEYGIVAKKNQSITPGDNTGGGETDDPNKGNQGDGNNNNGNTNTGNTNNTNNTNNGSSGATAGNQNNGNTNTGTNNGADNKNNNTSNNSSATNNSSKPKTNSKQKIRVARPLVIKKSLSKSRKRAKLTWRKVKGASGYEVKYCSSKSFSKKKTKRFRTKRTTYTCTLKGKKSAYYARVRAYKIVKGKKYYSGWSSITRLRKAKK